LSAVIGLGGTTQGEYVVQYCGSGWDGLQDDQWEYFVTCMLGLVARHSRWPDLSWLAGQKISDLNLSNSLKAGRLLKRWVEAIGAVDGAVVGM